MKKSTGKKIGGILVTVAAAAVAAIKIILDKKK